MSNLGYIKLHRALLRSPEWVSASPEQKAVLITILLRANYKPAVVDIKGRPVKVPAGSFITSYRNLASDAGVSYQKLRSILKRLIVTQFLTQVSTQHYTLLTVCKWGSYQSSEETTNTESNTESNNKQEIKEIKEGVKLPLSIRLAKRMQAIGEVYIDPEKDYKRLHYIGMKIKTLIKDNKRQQGLPYNSCNEAEIEQGFDYLIKSLSEWELENRFFPEYILSHFSSIVNKSRKQKPKKEALTSKAFKNIR